MACTQRKLLRCTHAEERLGLRERYKKAKREVRKAISEAKNTAYKKMSERPKTKEGEIEYSRLPKQTSVGDRGSNEPSRSQAT
ncbi:hypothetical protein Hdeb2414_s0016g00480251 [Helianthus debilis subsp. tardiflorus]